jgi:hypothetical protein
LREDCGVVSIWRSDTRLPTSDVFTSRIAAAETVTARIVVVLAALAGGVAPGATAAATRLTVAVEATLKVTVCAVPGPAPTTQVPGGNPTRA